MKLGPRHTSGISALKRDWSDLMERRTVLGGAAASALIVQTVQRAAVGQPLMPTPRPGGGMGSKTAHAEGATVLITGANRGIGLGFVKVFLERGAKKVYATGRNPENLPAVKALDPGRVETLVLDVNNNEHRQAALAVATDVTWLINNAAIPGSFTKKERRILSSSSLADCKFVMQTNCWSPAELARLFTPTILENGGGAIANILSVGAWVCLPEFTSYSMSRSAAAIMTAGLRAELDKEPILVSGIFTGGVRTRAAPQGSGGGVSPEEHAREVLDKMARGDTDVFAAGSEGIRQRILEDPYAFERNVIERFHTNPVSIAPY